MGRERKRIHFQRLPFPASSGTCCGFLFPRRRRHNLYISPTPTFPIFNFRLRPPSPSVPYLFFGTLYTDIKRERKRVQWRRKRRRRRGGEVFSDGGEDSSSLHCNSPPPARRCRFTPLLRPSLPLKASLAVRESATGAQRKKRKSVRQGGGKSTEPRLREQK